jgi:hypothetical protein
MKIDHSHQQWLADNTPLTLRTAASRAVSCDLKYQLQLNEGTFEIHMDTDINTFNIQFESSRIY